MRHFIYIVLMIAVPAAASGLTGAPVLYEVDGEPYEGYYISPSDQAPLVHDLAAAKAGSLRLPAHMCHAGR